MSPNCAYHIANYHHRQRFERLNKIKSIGAENDSDELLAFGQLEY